jgi:quinol monooxygenase YgiN
MMVHVIAQMKIKEGKMEAMLALFEDLVPLVRAEAGCIRYDVCLDADVDLGAPKDPLAITIVEAWESAEHLAAHLKIKHMADFREKVGDLRESSQVKVLSVRV